MATLERPGRGGMHGVRTPWTLRVGAGVVTLVALAAAVLPARTMILVDHGRADLGRGDAASAEGKFGTPVATTTELPASLRRPPVWPLMRSSAGFV